MNGRKLFTDKLDTLGFTCVDKDGVEWRKHFLSLIVEVRIKADGGMSFEYASPLSPVTSITNCEATVQCLEDCYKKLLYEMDARVAEMRDQLDAEWLKVN